jgi:hypothetical protein
MPMRGKLPTVVARSYDAETSARYQRPHEAERTAYDDLQGVVVFCAIGLLLTVNMVLWFPGFGAMASALEIFP